MGENDTQNGRQGERQQQTGEEHAINPAHRGV